jgi:DNA gyrase/topoisomerase IV subunit A
MATNIPPHNLNEVVDACLHLLRHPDASIDDLMDIVPAPDFPTAGIIYGISGVKEGYRTGRGRVVMRAKCHFEDIDRGQRQAIIVDELPYQVNKKTLQERMAELVHEKKIEGISHIQDESDKSGMRLVIELKRGEVPEVVLNNLYKQTQLQDTFGMNMVALIDGQPRLCNLKDLIDGVLVAPPRSGHTTHRVQPAQSPRTRPCARRSGRGLGQYRRVHRHHPQRAHASCGQGRADEQALGQPVGAHHAHPRTRPMAA